ncbi:hypothetical protein [Sphingobium sp.]|nr:hypothetical protein [Sphingobium sp.]
MMTILVGNAMLFRKARNHADADDGCGTDACAPAFPGVDRPA